jgi:cysteinyl-tRNA synthetase, unknown class
MTTALLLLAAAILIAAVAYIYGRRSAALPVAKNPAPNGVAEPPQPMPNVSPSNTPQRPRPTASAPPPSATRSTPHITSWGYQLQNLDVAEASASPFDLLVIDPAKDGDDESTLTPAEVARLKRKPDGSRRLVIAYLSIGEAESYRGYWRPEWTKNKPAWLLAENPEWKENYAVCFWDPGWQSIMCGSHNARLDRIIAAGFDGVYLDKCDVFEDMREHKMTEAKARSDLEGDMTRFITRLSQHAKSKRPDFLVIMQNTESLLDRAEVRRVLDGSAKEELLFGLDGPEKRNDADAVTWSRNQFDLMKRDGKFVLVVEYLNNPQKIAEARTTISQLGYTLTISPKNRELKSLIYPPTDGDAIA